MKAYLILILLGATVISCSSSKKTSSKKIPQVLIATKQNWAGGPAGSGSGTHYKFQVQMTNKEVRFDSVWVGRRKFALKPAKSAETNNAKVMNFLAERYIPGEADVQTGTPPELPESVLPDPPIVYHGRALLRYWKDGEAMYVVVTTFKALEPIMMP